MSAPILVIGSFIQDLTFYVDHFPAPGETLMGLFATGPGGKGSNQAIAAARTGVKTAFVGAVGEDTFGNEAENFHASENVEHHFIRVAMSPTGTAGILVNANGQNSIVVALGASEKFAAHEVDVKLIESAEVIVLQFEIHLETVRELLALGRKNSKTTILNPAPMQSTMDFSLLENVDIFIPNETEFTTVVQHHPATANTNFSVGELASIAPEDLHELCRKLGVPTVIVTLGERGCFISQAVSFEIVSACRGISAVDTTGAGDAFVGGFASGLIQFDGDVVRAARYGNIVAGLSVTKRGTAPAMPQQTEIDAFLADQGSLESQ